MERTLGVKVHLMLFLIHTGDVGDAHGPIVVALFVADEKLFKAAHGCLFSILPRKKK
jgi:hypothetical protein